MNFKRVFTFTAACACAFGIANADSTIDPMKNFPTAAEIQKNMGMGFNIGNTMEVPKSPTAWGNAYPTQALLDSIKAAGFNTVRIPCAWDSHAPGGVITESWLDSVKTVVDYAMRAGLYTILNIHHEGEGGWFQTNIGTSVDNNINTKMKNYWTQIANKFKNYDEHLLFAAANEPGPNINTWTAAHVNTLMTYYKTFIDAVRSSGSYNNTRTLIIQGLNTDIDKSVANAPTSVFPQDNVKDRLMFEVHYYDPYQYTLMTSEQDWGAPTGMIQSQYYYGDYTKASEPKRNAGYNAWADAIDAKLGSITHPNEQFAKIKTNYVDKGYPVIIGEFGANTRSPELSGSDLELSKQGRVQWHKDVVTAAKNYGLTPILWDMGNESNTGYDNMAYIRHNNANQNSIGKILDVDVINAMRSVFGLGEYVNTGITHQDNLVPSESEEPRCKALSPECGYTPEELCNIGIEQYCNSDAINSSVQKASTNLVRQGNLLIAQGFSASIQLFDVNGNLIRKAQSTSANATMNLEGINKGMYIAKSGHKTLKVILR